MHLSMFCPSLKGNWNWNLLPGWGLWQYKTFVNATITDVCWQFQCNLTSNKQPGEGNFTFSLPQNIKFPCVCIPTLGENIEMKISGHLDRQIFFRIFTPLFFNVIKHQYFITNHYLTKTRLIYKTCLSSRIPFTIQSWCYVLKPRVLHSKK